MAQDRNFSPVELLDLIAVYETGSMGKAAERNGRTKPAVSMAITRLERAVGFEILERPSWTVKFTDRGEALVLRARSVMAEHEALAKLAEVLATGIEPQISVAVDQAAPKELWSSIIAELASTYPNTKLELIAADGTKGSELLRSGQVNVALVLDNTLVSSDDLEWEIIQDVELVEVCRTGTAFHGAERPSSLPQIVLIDDPHHIDCQHAPRCIHVSSRMLQLSLVLDGTGWARLPAHLLEDQLEIGKLIQFSPPADMPFHPSVLVCRTKEPAGPAARSLWELFTK
ncbi:LysR family transcriptional regulator [Novosphingobium sp. JCM 18896]|uniref:LysR family transcriptional regulator n=1 Tax=Novosphingobium sp. JCM 18896 TaxID=2989731 RepID=UPI0022214699|nr:LysR family transcriptional regulator [Novosphingobium sp. JCM 18896]